MPTPFTAVAKLPNLLSRWSLNRWTVRLKHMLHNDCCRHCFDVPVRGETLFCHSCRETLGLRDVYPVAADADNGYTVHSATSMNPAIKKLLYPYKFYHQYEHTLTLAHVMQAYWQQVSQQLRASGVDMTNVWVVTIPARKDRNHMAAIGREFAYAQNLPVLDTLLSWAKTTEPQHTLHRRSDRLHNMRDAFEVDPHVWEMALNNHGMPTHIVVLDDLTTTGATCQASHQAWRRWLGHQTLDIPVTHLTLCHVPFQLRRHHQAAALLEGDALTLI